MDTGVRLFSEPLSPEKKSGKCGLKALSLIRDRAADIADVSLLRVSGCRICRTYRQNGANLADMKYKMLNAHPLPQQVPIHHGVETPFSALRSGNTLRLKLSRIAGRSGSDTEYGRIVFS